MKTLLVVLTLLFAAPVMAGHNTIHNGLIEAQVPYMYLSCIEECEDWGDNDRVIVFSEDAIATVCSINGVTKVELAVQGVKVNAVHICEPI